MDAALDHATVTAADPTNQTGDALALASHLRDALFRVDSARLAPFDAPSGLVVAGMGGSAVGARLAAAVIGPRARKPLLLSPGYDVPSFVDASWLVLCASYSGGTEETLAAYDAAGAAGAQRLVASTGGELAERARRDGVSVIGLPSGFQPRAAVGYGLVVALEVAALAGVAPSLREEIEAAAALAEGLADEWGPDGAEDGEAKALARRLDGAVPVISGAELTAPVAYRWKTQFNENAEIHAFASELPELDHNEIVGWPSAKDYGRFALVHLEDVESHPRIVARVGLTLDLAAPGAVAVERVSARGSSRAERLVSLVLLGDLVSLYAAVLRGADPVSIEPINALKSALSKDAEEQSAA